MRLSDFWDRFTIVFGAAYAPSVAADHVLTELDGRTVDQALLAGVPARQVWRAVVAAFPDRVPSHLR